MGLRAQAVADAKRILEDLSGFGWPLTLTSPSGVSASHVGFTTDVAETIDPETGVAVSGRRASVAISLLSLPVLPSAVPESTRRPWVVTFDDATLNTPTRWKVVEVLPDRALGVVVLLLEAYRLVVVSGTLTLPSLGLTGSLTPRVPMSGTLTLPELALEGSLERPVVTLGAAALTLPTLALAGGIRPAVALSGSLTWPAPQLAGGITPAVSLAGSPTLPSLALAGGATPAVTVAGALTLPSLRIWKPTEIASLVAHWSGNGSTGASAPNRITSSVGALAQATPADQPAIITLDNGVKALSFDGVNSDMKTPDVAALRFTAKGYWAWHLRSVDTGTQGTKYLGMQYAEGGTIERIRVSLNSQAGTSTVTIAITATSIATIQYGPLLAEVQAGCFLEVLYDGSLASADRLVLSVDGVPAAIKSITGTIPAVLLEGDALNYWIGSLNGSTNKLVDIAHHYVGSDIPTAGERSALRAFEVPLWPTENLYVSPIYTDVNLSGWPPTTMANDIGILVVETANQPVDTPSGWTAVPNGSQGIGTPGGSTATLLQTFWKRATSSTEPTPTMSPVGDHAYALIATFRGCISTGDPIDTSAGNATADTASTAVAIPGGTTTVPNCLIVAIACRDTDNATARQSGESNPSLSNVIERVDAGTTTGNGGGHAMVTGIKAVAGAYSATTATLATAARQGRVSLALKPNP